MVSRNTVSLLLAVIAFGLVLGPISYFLQETIKPQTPGTVSIMPNKTTLEPIQPVRRYEAVSQGVVKSKEGTIIINARSDFGDEKKINETLQAIPGVIDVAFLNKTENPGETGLYLYRIHLTVDPNDTEKVGYYVMTRLTKEPFKFILDSIGVPAKILLPTQLNMTKVPSGSWKTIQIPEEVDGYVYCYTNVNQTTTFFINAIFVGSKLNIMAFEKSRIYIPPIETTTVKGSVRVINITGYGATFSTNYDLEVNTTELREKLVQQGINASVSFIPPPDSFQVKINNSIAFVEKLNESGIKAQAFPGGVTIWVNDSLNETMKIVRSIDPTVESPQLTGSITVISKQPLDKVIELIPGNLTKKFLMGFVFVPNYNDTVETMLPINVREDETIQANITVNTIFGDIQHPVTVETFYK